MSDNIKLEKLDARHSLNQFFTHRTKMTGSDSVPKWLEMREWLWDQYGRGLEYETVWIMQYHPGKEYRWAWRIDDKRYYLYLKEEILTHFSLKYLNT